MFVVAVLPMRVDGTWYRTIWLHSETTVKLIDQRHLPHEFVVEDITTVDAMAEAIRDMHLRGAGLIGCAAAFGMYLAARESAAACSGADGVDASSAKFTDLLAAAGAQLCATRPTAVNLQVGVKRVQAAIGAAAARDASLENAVAAAKEEAIKFTDEDADFCKRIGEAGAQIIKEIAAKKLAAAVAGEEPVVNILTHCNAGWLAFADWGSALSPVYAAFDEGVRVHVWVDETRPRNQGAALTAWELGKHGVQHTVIADNAGGHLMQRGLVDMVITGADRVTRAGDACNKIGTYLKALAAKDNDLPFYVALPSSTIDWDLENGEDIPIEQRGGDEVRYAEGLCDGKRQRVLLTPAGSPAGNWAFDVTPRRLVTGLLTERGLSEASEAALARLYPERAVSAKAA